MQQIAIKIINTSSNPLPSYATVDSSGVDLMANIDTDIVLKPLERKLIPTGIFVEIPSGYEAQIRPRSGLAIKQGITCLNSPGTIDADYRGEINVIIINLSDILVTITNGMRIAQMVFAPVTKVNFIENVTLSNTQRGEGGFGSTGV
ncbi:MAG: dUTP diphosphatase [Chitinophagaceae bacterium]